MEKQKYFVLMSVSDWKKSKNPRNPDYRIVIMKDMITNKQYHTYIGVGFKNMAQWNNVLNKVWGIYTGIRVKDNNLIDGDSEPKLIEELTAEETKNYRLYGTIDKPVRPETKAFDNDLFSFGE